MLFLCSEIDEEFPGFSVAESVAAEAVVKYITVALSDIGVDIRLCVCQSYDGAAVMSAIYPVFNKE